MTIPSLNKKNQDWKRPTYIKKSDKNIKRKKSDNFNYKKRENKKGKLKSILNNSIPILIFTFLLISLFSVGTLAWMSKDLPNPEGLINRNVTVSTKIYDRTGEIVLYDIHGDIKRTLINFEQIPEYVIQATLAAEDRNFYNHKGFSFTGIIRSVLKNITTGSKVGGSTLTQQFVKNAVLTNEKTYTRKIKEFLISYRLEKKFTKDEILQMYFNEIPYGSVIYGIEAASQSFFGKTVNELTIAEGAILAAIPKAPTYYSPYGNNKDKLINRQQYIIDSMVELDYISQEEGEKAKQEKIIFKPINKSIIAPHFVMYVRELLSEKYGEEFINQEGLKVYTTLDLEKQKIAEEAIKNGIDTNSEKYQFTNASLVAIDPKTGQILSMVGSADYFNNDIDGQVNVSLRPRQPGSSFKPIVYTASFIKGYTPNTILYDVVTNFDNTGTKPYEPKNYDLKEYGPVSIRQALAGSLNIPAVKITYLTGINNILDLTDNLGYTTLNDRDRFGLSIVLGGGEVKLIEHVNAFATIANEGIKHEINPILKIENKDGNILFEYKEKKKKIIEPEITRQITDILSDDNARSYIFGSGSKLTLPNRPVATKTGTTNDYRDAWTIGFTPNLVTGVWVGNNNNTEMKRGAAGGVVAAPIWHDFMKNVLKDTPVENFNKPEKIITEKPILNGEIDQEKIIKIDTISGKLATQYTPEETIKEIKIKEIHNILHYINKDDPRGPIPENPTNDPQYDNWEKSLQRWAQEQGFENTEIENIPTEYDDIHKPEDKPNLIIIKPLNNQDINNLSLDIEINATANRGIEVVEYYIDNKLIKTSNNSNINQLDLSEFLPGKHQLTIKVIDDLKNSDTKNIDLNFNFQSDLPDIIWNKNNLEIKNFPFNLNIEIKNYQEVKKIDFYYQNKSEGMEQYITHSTPSEPQISFVWQNKPEIGEYTIYGYIFTKNNKKYLSSKLNISIK